jgi:glycosyltransferase involved in cell wall biosynthesis
MKRIAIIFDGSLTDRKGLVNAVLYRAKYLKSVAKDFQIDIYNFQGSENYIVRKLRQTKKQKRYTTINVEGLDVKVFWYTSTLLDYILSVKLKKRPWFSRRAYTSKASLFKQYDLISAHSTNCSLLAYKIKKKYGIPYYVTWHGSDIHTAPFHKDYARQDTIAIMDNAECNFFVSKALLDTSNKLTLNARKSVLYNGVGPSFLKYDKEKRDQLREFFLVQKKKVVCFAGNMIDVKNPYVLPKVFKEVKEKYKGDITFWVIGDGKLRPTIERQLLDLQINCKFWGNVPVDKMADYLNCVDVLVLPSKNEGLPLITVEALKCGANVVGSDVGGISEVIGKENVFQLDTFFVEKVSHRIVDMLSFNITQELSNIFDWARTAEIEYDVYNRIILEERTNQ